MGAAHEYSSVQRVEEEHERSSSSAEFDCPSSVGLLIMVTLVTVIVGGIVGLVFWISQTADQVPHYSVAIDSVSGLDPAMDLGKSPVLHPEFNLTLRVASQGLWVSKCVEPGMYTEVSYRGVSLAASATVVRRICAGPRKAVDHPLVVTGAGVVVPGSVLDSLAMDMRSGTPLFEVNLHGPSPMDVVWACGLRQVGDNEALGTECN